MMKEQAVTGGATVYAILKLSFTWDSIDEAPALHSRLRHVRCASCTSTTEVGVISARIRAPPTSRSSPGSLGKPVPNVDVDVSAAGRAAAARRGRESR